MINLNDVFSLRRYRSVSLPLMLVAGLTALLFISCRKRDSNAKPANVDYYTCSMHPSVKKLNPKDKCPICSMDLTPVKKKGAPAAHVHSNQTAVTPEAPVRSGADDDKPGEFTVAVERQQQIGVTYTKIEKRSFTNSIRAAGIVAFDKERHWDYVARVDGYVEKLFVFSRGQPIEKDAPLLNLYSPDLFTTQKEFVDALKVRDEARARGNQAMTASTDKLVDSAKQRLKLWNIPEKKIAELEKERTPQEYLTLNSPFKGVVRDIGVDQGRKVTPGDHLVDIVDLSVVWVWAQFYQDDLAILKKDIPVIITTSSHPGEKFSGKISLVDPFLDDATRTVRVRIDVPNPDLKLRPNMYVDVELVEVAGEGIGVPVPAVLPTGRRNIVFVDKGQGKLEPRFIELGRKFGDFHEVKSGLQEMERVVSSANFLIDAEAKVQGALKSW